MNVEYDILDEGDMSRVKEFLDLCDVCRADFGWIDVIDAGLRVLKEEYGLL
jgi:hypothetical protein